MPRTKPTVTYKKKDGIAIISMNRPEYNNAQNGKMTYDLDKFFKKAVDDVISNTGFEIAIQSDSITSMPSSEELVLIREVLDPQGIRNTIFGE